MSRITSYPYGLTDLITGITPTLVGWDTNPTTHTNITDGDTSTTCDDGSKVIDAAYGYGYFEWLFPEQNIITTGAGSAAATAGTPRLYLYIFDGTTWRKLTSYIGAYGGTSRVPMLSAGCQCEGVRLGVTSTSASTISPNISCFNVWGLKK